MDEVISKIKELYGIEAETPEKVTKGFLTENYILSSKDKKYFLKKYRVDTEEEIKKIHEAKKYFADGGIPVILPILNKDGKTFFFSGGGYYALFPFITDREVDKKQLSDTAIISMAETLAKIHLLGKGATFPANEEFKGWNKEKLLKKGQNILEIIMKDKVLDDYAKSALEDIKWRMGAIESNNIKFEDFNLKNDHMIHGDYHSYNLFFDDTDHVSYVFDWEKVAYAPRAYELIRSLMVTFYQGSDGEDTDKARLYLNSYSKIYPISKEEMKAGLRLYQLRFLHSFWVPAEHYIKHNYRVDGFLAERFHLAKFLSENLEELESKLFD